MQRQLTDRERNHLIEVLNAKTTLIKMVMNVFRGFGGFLILAIIYCIIFEDVNKADIPFMLVGCVIIFLVFFKSTGFLAKQNTWAKLLRIVKKKQEYVFDGTLINSYKTRHGERNGATENIGNVNIDGQEVRCHVEEKLMENIPGMEIALVCDYPDYTKAFRFAIKKMY